MLTVTVNPLGVTNSSAPWGIITVVTTAGPRVKYIRLATKKINGCCHCQCHLQYKSVTKRILVENIA